MEYNREFFVQAGKRGGDATKAKYGKKHFKKIAKNRAQTPRHNAAYVKSRKKPANKP